MNPKPTGGRNYGSIPHLLDSKLGHHDKFIDPGQDRIIRAGGRDRHDTVLISLKLDGTNVGVLKTAEGLVTLQRRGYECNTSPYEQHHAFDRWVRANHERFHALLEVGERLVGEWLWQASGLWYEIRGVPFYAFDLFDADGARILQSDLYRRCQPAGIKTVPSLVADSIGDTPLMFYVVSLSSLLPGVHPYGEDHEGLVFRVERKGKVDYLVKWVRGGHRGGHYLPDVGLPEGAEIKLNAFRGDMEWLEGA